ncbi:hypothetical protein IJG27_00925 [Candidatus Saccharibacteria bacterium]|nr:hypothetical protein [Candidatus Saccharibacteria bacterium]
MNTGILICRAPSGLASITPSTPAFFPASAVGEIYNYAIASAGTIVNKSDTDDSGNINTATESICPKGWTLPSIVQINNNRDISNFSPVKGGQYNRGVLGDEASRGSWWGFEAHNSAVRYYLRYGDNSLYTGNNAYRSLGYYIRCVSEEKTVTDLTYLQDMTGGIANKIVGFFICLK